jgi:hypothetical protein
MLHFCLVIYVAVYCFDRYIQSTCATSGEGLYEGLDWLSSNIASKVCRMPIYVFHLTEHLVDCFTHLVCLMTLQS